MERRQQAFDELEVGDALFRRDPLAHAGFDRVQFHPRHLRVGERACSDMAEESVATPDLEDLGARWQLEFVEPPSEIKEFAPFPDVQFTQESVEATLELRLAVE